MNWRGENKTPISTWLNISVGERIRFARGEKTQLELAGAIGIQRSSLAKIEAGKQKATLEVLYLIAKVLNLSIESLLPKIEEFTDLMPINKTSHRKVLQPDSTTNFQVNTIIKIIEEEKIK